MEGNEYPLKKKYLRVGATKGRTAKQRTSSSKRGDGRYRVPPHRPSEESSFQNLAVALHGISPAPKEA